MSDYKLTIDGKKYPFKWTVKAIRNTQEECKDKFGCSFEDATQNEHELDAYCVAIFHGIIAGGDKVSRETIEDCTRPEIYQVVAIFMEELKKFQEVVGINEIAESEKP